ncbi:serine/arginine repetitive matrix protein 2-like [Leguminivora glycinivorella]|uniref:serine/arginine repetitive matrix protein 2-like n=1 Tax=Leguminivora glycinivorella TaxID=1035111 RepID=UPI00200E3B8E|nr:serine/arginine repetitive matrix protein 2-like [Leguminivora glycinivorella]
MTMRDHVDSIPSGPSDKRFSHDSGLSDTSYKRDNRQSRRHRTDPIKNVDEPRRGTKSVAESRRGKSHATRRGESETRRGKSRETRRSKTREAQRSDSSGTRRGKSREARRSDSGEARRGKSREAGRVDSGESRRGKSGARRGKTREARRGKSGSVRRSSGSRSSFRDTLERALRDQQAQIARVAQMCELQARSGAPASERRSERHSELSERRRRPSERRGDKRNERSEREESGRTSSETTEFSSSSSSVDAVKRRTSECRTYKIIMSKLDELNRLFVARRAAGAPGAPAPGALAPKPPGALVPKLPAARAHDDSSVTVSDKVVGTESPKHTARKAEFEHNRTIIVAAAAVDIPPAQRLNCNVVTESVVRDERESGPASEKGMPGHFHLDDPVRLYQQAKRLEARVTRNSSSDSPDSGRSSRGSSHSGKGSSHSGKGSRSPSLCALCRCYWLVARRYVAQLNPVRE